MRIITVAYSFYNLFIYWLFYKNRDYFDAKFSKKIRLSFEQLGPVYIKLGQILSTRPDYIKEIYCQEFEYLLDSGTHISYDQISKHLSGKLNVQQQKIVTKLGEAIASASLSLVYKHTLENGKIVAIKILRPGVNSVIRKDFKILRFFVSLFGKYVGNTGSKHWLDLVDEIESWLIEETDYNNELKNIEIMRLEFSSQENIIIPKSYPELSNKHMLVMEWIEGHSVLDFIRLKRKNELPEFNFTIQEKLEELIRDVAINSLLRGYFHADLHPANIIITKEGKIALIDFGLIKFFSREARRGTTFFMMGVAMASPELIFKSAEMLGKEEFVFEREDVYEQLSKLLYDYTRASTRTFSSTRVILEILKICMDKGFKYPWGLILYTRGAVNLDGQILRLYPEFSFSSYSSGLLLEVYLKEFIQEKTSMPHLVDMFEDMSSLSLDFPQKIRIILDKLVQDKKND